jgi:hypothetical protein
MEQQRHQDPTFWIHSLTGKVVQTSEGRGLWGQTGHSDEPIWVTGGDFGGPGEVVFTKRHCGPRLAKPAQWSVHHGQMKGTT